jgi:hypothetical protein
LNDEADSHQKGASQPAYPPPLDRLFQFGNARDMLDWHEGQRDYPAELGLTGEHVPQLIAIAQSWTDEEAWSDDEQDVARWAPVHAWRTLGQLRAAQAVAPLVEMLNVLEAGGDDWSLEEFPYVFGLIGEEAFEALDRFLRGDANTVYARVCAIHGLEQIAALHPEMRARCVAVLHEVLEGYRDQDPSLNAFLVSYLLELGASDSAELMERAYADDQVNESIAGAWGEARRKLGVAGTGLAADGPRDHWNPLKALRLPAGDSPTPRGFRAPKTGKAQRRAKRKDQRKARRKGRK